MNNRRTDKRDLFFIRETLVLGVVEQVDIYVGVIFFLGSRILHEFCCKSLKTNVKFICMSFYLYYIHMPDYLLATE